MSALCQSGPFAALLCFGVGRLASEANFQLLASDPIVLDNDPSSLINLVLNGSKPLVAKGTPDPYRLPQFRLQYSDQEIADVITFIRNGWGNQAPTVTAAQVTELRNRLFDHLVGAPQKCGRKV